MPPTPSQHLPTLYRDVKDCNLVLEVRDVRLPLSSGLPFLERKFESKKKILLLTKADQASPLYLKALKAYFIDVGAPFFLLSPSTKPKNVLKLFNSLPERYKADGSLLGVLRVMISGLPNVGKSTIINTVRGKKVAKVGNMPGVTKGRQWIKINSRCYLLDTPGVASLSHTNDREKLLKFAACRMVSESSFDMEELALYLHEKIVGRRKFHSLFQDGFVPWSDSYEEMSSMACARFALKMPGGIDDKHRAARKFFEFVEKAVLPGLDMDGIEGEPS